MKFSSESLQIWYMDSMYHANQFIGNYMLIDIIIFCYFLSIFNLQNLAFEYYYIPS